MIDKVISTVERYQMLKKGATVIVALSGGADSMALLSVLISIRNNYDLTLIAAHVNHGLRGEEAARDENFVKEHCQRLGIELRVLNENIKVIAENSGEGLEECGRRIRYEFFNTICKDAVIATAHTLSDCLETTLFNLTRGSVLKGICGIPPVRDNIIRPLIECSRTEIEEYCRQNNISYVTDSTNSEDNYMRNHIRHNIVPQLKLINPMFDEAYHRCLNSLIDDENLLNELSLKLVKQAETENGYKTDVLLDAHVSLRKRAIANIIMGQTGIPAQNKHIQAVDELLLGDGDIQIHQAAIVRVKAGVLKFPPKNIEILPWSIELHEGPVDLPFTKIRIEIVNKKDLENIQNIHNNILDYCFDYDKIKANPFIRNRCEGDKIKLSKRNCTKSLKKLFNESGIPPDDRNKVIIICDDDGLIWVEGFGCAERCSVCNETERVCIIFLGRTENA